MILIILYYIIKTRCYKFSIPLQDRKVRLFKTPVIKTLSDVEVGRTAVYDYIYGSVVYAEMNIKIGRKNIAVDRLQGAIDFLQSMSTSGIFDRVEQWNKQKDLFCTKGISEQITVLRKELKEIDSYTGLTS